MELLNKLKMVFKRPIADREATETPMPRTEMMFRRLLESAPDAIVIADRRGAIILVNTQTETMFGYQREELLGQPVEILLPERFRQVHVSHRNDYHDEPRVRPMGSGLDLAGRRKDGSEFSIEISLSPLETDEGMLVTSVIRDVTARKQAEEAAARLAAIIASSSDAIISETLEGEIVTWNAGAQRLYGYTAEEAIGRSFSFLLPPGSPDEAISVFERIKRGETAVEYETVRMRKDGRLVDIALTLSPIKNAIGKLVGVSTIARDITARREIARMKDEFIAVVSHELRTPLTSIRGSLGLLAGGVLGTLSDKGERMVRIAVSNADRLVRLVNDMLDIERMESGKVTMQKQWCEVITLMTQATELMRPLAEKAGVRLVVQAQPVRLWADADRIVQALTNLLNNAIKFSPAGGTVRLGVERRDTRLVFRVVDQGRGIPTDKLESIFGRFQQVDASDSRDKGGTGLGLAICRSIIQQHGGQIWAESEVGKGSAFFLAIPMTKMDSQETQEQLPSTSFQLLEQSRKGGGSDNQESKLLSFSTPPSRPTSNSDPQPLASNSQPLVLVCDDEPWNRDIAQHLLRQQGYRVLTVASGQEAVEQAVAEHPSVVLLDLNMPGMDGWDTVAALKERNETREIPVIIASTLSPKDALQPPEAVDWLIKPLDRVSLFESLERVWKRLQGKAARVLIVEDDDDLAQVLIATFQHRGIETLHAQSQHAAIQLCQHEVPDLVVLDLVLPDGDGFGIVEWLRRKNRLRQVPLVVYSAKDLDDNERERLRWGETCFLNKGRVRPEEFERQVVTLLGQVIGNRAEGFPAKPMCQVDNGATEAK